MTPPAVLLLSGGLDSAVLLARAVAAGSRPRCLAFSYGQRHARELDCSRDLARRYGCDWEVVAIPPGILAGSAVTGGGPVPHAHFADPAQLATVVPNRNMVFVALAAARAVACGAPAVLLATHAGDHPVYPDCRPEFLAAVCRATWLGCSILVEAPFQRMSKREVVELGRALGCPFEATWSCYEGGEVACGMCGACVERAEALA